MARHLHLRLYLSVDELARRYWTAYEPFERGWVQAMDSPRSSPDAALISRPTSRIIVGSR